MKLSYRTLTTILIIVALFFSIWPDIFSDREISNWIVIITLVILFIIIVRKGGNAPHKTISKKIKK